MKSKNFSATMTTKRRIITFSGRMRSGKGILCKSLEKNFGAKTMTMAAHLKELCCRVLDIEVPCEKEWTIEKLDKWKNERATISESGLTLSEESIRTIAEISSFDAESVRKFSDGIIFHDVRELIQKIGTDIIRAIDPEWHIKCVLKDISALPENTIVCIEDIRFKNELEAFRKEGATSFFVIRNNAENVSNHPSETELSFSDFPDNRILLNISSEKEFCNEFLAEMDNHFYITVNNPISLIEFPEYRDVNRAFGKERTPIVNEIVRQNSKNEMFLKDGVITFRNNVNFKLEEVLKEMSLSGRYTYKQVSGRFVIDNILAYENIKRWF